MFAVERGPCELDAEREAVRLSMTPEVRAAASELGTPDAIVAAIRGAPFVADDGGGEHGGIACGDVVQRVGGVGGLNCYERATLALALLLAQDGPDAVGGWTVGVDRPDGAPPLGSDLRIITVELPTDPVELHTVLQARDASHPDGWRTITLDSLSPPEDDSTMPRPARNAINAATLQQLLPYLMQSNPQMAILLYYLLMQMQGGSVGGSSTTPGGIAPPTGTPGTQPAAERAIDWSKLQQMGAALQAGRAGQPQNVLDYALLPVRGILDWITGHNADPVINAGSLILWIDPSGNLIGDGGNYNYSVENLRPSDAAISAALPPGYHFTGPYLLPIQQPGWSAPAFNNNRLFFLAVDDNGSVINPTAVGKAIGTFAQGAVIAPPYRPWTPPEDAPAAVRNGAAFSHYTAIRQTDWYGIIKGILDVLHPIGTAVLTGLLGPAGAGIAAAVGAVESAGESALKSATDGTASTGGLSDAVGAVIKAAKSSGGWLGGAGWGSSSTSSDGGSSDGGGGVSDAGVVA